MWCPCDGRTGIMQTARWKEEEGRREQLRAAKTWEVVERDVEMGLKRPEGAVLGGVKAGRGW